MIKNLVSIPRIISIVLFIILIVSSLIRGLGFQEIFMLIVALIILFAPKEYSIKQFGFFLESLKLNRNYLLVVLFDTLFYFILFVSGYLISSILSSKTAFIQQHLKINPETITSPIALEGIQSSIRIFFVYFIIAIVSFVLISLVSYALFKSLGWSIILNKKFNKDLFKKFLEGNALWWLIWLLPAFIFIFALRPDFIGYVYIIIFLLYFHTTTIVHFSITKTMEIKSSIAKAFTIGFGNIHYFLVPYAFAFIIYFIIFQIFSYAQFLISSKMTLALSFAFVLFYLAWFKSYLAKVVEEMNNYA